MSLARGLRNPSGRTFEDDQADVRWDWSIPTVYHAFARSDASLPQWTAPMPAIPAPHSPQCTLSSIAPALTFMDQPCNPQRPPPAAAAWTPELRLGDYANLEQWLARNERSWSGPILRQSSPEYVGFGEEACSMLSQYARTDGNPVNDHPSYDTNLRLARSSPPVKQLAAAMPGSSNTPGVADAQLEPPSRSTYNPHLPTDLYTPPYIRGKGARREGYCMQCKRWLKIKSSEYWYDKMFRHGISAATGHHFNEPLGVRYVHGIVPRLRATQIAEGCCPVCKLWIPLGKLTVAKHYGVLWIRHAYKVRLLGASCFTLMLMSLPQCQRENTQPTLSATMSGHHPSKSTETLLRSHTRDRRHHRRLQSAPAAVATRTTAHPATPCRLSAGVTTVVPSADAPTAHN